MPIFCEYQNILGVPGEGAHALRVQLPFNIGPSLAIVDIVLTAVLAYLIHRYVSKKFGVATLFFGLWAVGIVLHILFCVPTGLNVWIGGLLFDSNIPQYLRTMMENVMPSSQIN